MLFQTSIIAAFLAAQGMAASGAVTYNCSIAKNTCEQNVAAGQGDQSFCDQQFTACQACATQEHSCRVGADGNYSDNLKCTTSAQVCYEQAVSGGTTNGAYGCEEAFNSCSIAPMTNHSFCASQKGACETCQKEENSCRNKPGANQSLCSSNAGGCFAKAMSLN